MKYLYFIMPLITAFLLDFIIGDPYKLPHPVRLIGKMYRGRLRKLQEGFSVVKKQPEQLWL